MQSRVFEHSKTFYFRIYAKQSIGVPSDVFQPAVFQKKLVLWILLLWLVGRSICIFNVTIPNSMCELGDKPAGTGCDGKVSGQ